MRTGPLAVAGWVVAAALTLGVSWSAMSAVRTAVAPADLASGLPAPDETSSGPAGTSAPAPTSSAPRPGPTATTPAATALTRTGIGGTIRVRCTAGGLELASVIPRQGFTADLDDSPGEVKFTSDGHRTEMRASCAGGRPQVRVEEDDRGGDDDNSGPGGGGNSGPGGGDGD
ncbi:MAG TPA: hypothetical protein VE547_07500 [Mycobacteriales bacterium]|jgi:hypothetical protein|nr:hypothetical protein [Mycobacteriales bacterium]